MPQPAPNAINDLYGAFKHRMDFNFGEYGWSEEHFLTATSRPAAVSAGRTIALYRLTCLLASCQMSWSVVSDLATTRDGSEAEPYVGCVWPLDGFFGPGNNWELDLGGATGGTFTLTAGNGGSIGTSGALAFGVNAGGLGSSLVATGPGALGTVPGMTRATASGSGGVFTISGVPTNVVLTGNFATLTGATNPGLSGPGQQTGDPTWDVNEITDAIMIRSESSTGRWANDWVHGIPDIKILGGVYLGNIIMVQPQPPAGGGAPPAAPVPPLAPQTVIWGATSFDSVVADYINILWNNTAILTKTVNAGVPSYAYWPITKMKPKFVRGHKVGRPKDTQAGRRTPQ